MTGQQSFILNEDLLPQTIDHALGFINTKKQPGAKGVRRIIRYYGAFLHEQVTSEDRKGRAIHKTKESPAIITEEAEIFSEYNHPEEFSFSFGAIMGTKRAQWSLKGIRDFRAGLYDQEKATFPGVYALFKAPYDECMVFEQPEWYELNPLWDMCTYFFDMIDSFLIIKHEGHSGSAKSKAGHISAAQSFNGRSFLCPTPATFFRYRHHNKSMLFIEEAERLFADKQTKEDSALVEYLNGSYQKGNFVPRQSDKDNNLTEEFDPAGFTRLASIKPLKGALKQRSVTLGTVKARPGDPRAAKSEPKADSEQIKKNRDYAYICGLLHHKEYAEALANVENDYGLHNREWEVSKPIIAMARCIDKKLEKRMGAFLAQLFDVRDEPVDESSWEYQLGVVLLKLYATSDKPQFIATFAIRDQLNAKGHDFTTRGISTLMGSSFERFKTRNTERTERGFHMSFFDVAEVLLRQQTINIEKILIFVSEVSDTSVTVEKVKEWYRTYTGHLDTSTTKKPDLPDTSDGRTQKTKGMGVFSQQPKIGAAIIEVLRKNGGKMPYDELIKWNAKYTTPDIIQQLKNDGLIYEPRSGILGVLE